MGHRTGHVKRNPATNDVAVRSLFDEDDPDTAGQAWLVTGPVRGARFATGAEVADWDDLYTPPEPDGGG